MNLITLSVKNIRGLPDLQLRLDGKSAVIWGPNGSGKSGVVDAIDFLFTGRISRLFGEGTNGISHSQHGPHIDHDLESAVVSATVQLDGIPNHIEISRCMAQPKTIQCSDEIRPMLDSVIELMRRGGFILTRRDILKYITSEAGKRSEEIQELLRLKRVESVRKSLSKATNHLKRQDQSALRAIEKAKADVNVILGDSIYSDESLLERVNDYRKTLGGGPLNNHLAAGFKDGLLPPTAVEESSGSVNPDIYLQVIQNIRRDTEPESILELEGVDNDLRSNLAILRDDPALQSEYDSLKLSTIASEFIDQSTVDCPVCGAIWEEGHLKAHIEGKIATAEKAEKVRSRIADATSGLSGPGRNLRAKVIYLENNLRAAAIETHENDLQILSSWRERLDFLLGALESPADEYLDCGLSADDVMNTFVPPGVVRVLDRIESTTQETLPQRSTAQTAWDKLTQLKVGVQSLERRQRERQSAEFDFRRSSILLSTFLKARDSVLEGLYSRISARFVEFYGVLHEDEKKHFAAQLKLDRAALDFGVDFMGRGIHPPHAMHSEGHQDSMGICLFLALNEEFANKRVNLIVLDDVVMSIDTDHRKNVCRLLSEWFSDRQFVITTHDKIWTRQLGQEGVVNKSQVTEFTNWTVEGGPNTHFPRGLWEDIEADLDQENVENAAFRLRRGSEEFFEGVCDALGAKLVYNSRMSRDLGDWLDAAMREYGALLKAAVKSDSSWGKVVDERKLTHLDSLKSQIFDQANAERWSINPNVHFTSWANFTKKEFVPVVDAFRALHELFQCSKCGGLLEKLPRKGPRQIVKCPCGTEVWNLRRKANSQ
ncbi:MAG: AAA family ATPase [Caldilineaceae bacterium]|nr:AAA family ATPase [Caldilineaceae bacterium]